MGRRRRRNPAPQQVHIEANDKVITKYHGDANTVHQISRNQRDVDKALVAVEHEKARRPSKLVEGVVYLLSRGGKRDSRRMEVEQELQKLDRQCRAFTQAVRAMLNSEREKTRRFEALCQAIPHMDSGSRAMAMELLNKLGATSTLPFDAKEGLRMIGYDGKKPTS